MAHKTAAKKPAPDVKSVTAQVLENVAVMVESPTILNDVQLFALPPNKRFSKEESAVLKVARQLAANYIRLGAR